MPKKDISANGEYFTEINIADFFKKRYHVTNAKMLNFITANAIVRNFKRYEYYLHILDEENDFAFLYSGIIRCYSIDANGKGHTDCILSHPGDFIFSKTDNIHEGPAEKNEQFLTDGILICFHISCLAELIRRWPLEYAALQMAICFNIVGIHKEKAHILKLKPEKGYLWLLENRPELIKKVENQYLASYLDITPVSLSRIRGRVVENGTELPVKRGRKHS